MILALTIGCTGAPEPPLPIVLDEPEPKPIEATPGVPALVTTPPEVPSGAEKLMKVNVFLGDEPTKLWIHALPDESCAPGWHNPIAVNLGDQPVPVEARPSQCCEPFDRLRGPEGTVALVAHCDPVDCADCRSADQLVFVPIDAPGDSRVIDVGCGATNPGVPPPCASYVIESDRIVVTLPRQEVERCDDGIAQVRAIDTTLVLTRDGLTRSEGTWQPVYHDLWNCTP